MIFNQKGHKVSYELNFPARPGMASAMEQAHLTGEGRYRTAGDAEDSG